MIALRPGHVVVLLLSAPLCGQTYDDLMMVRNPRLPYAQLIQAKGGAFGSIASDKDPAAGLDDKVAWDGYVWYHDDSFGSRSGQIDAYAGRDGFVASIRDGKVIGNDTVSRLQLSARFWNFFREGFYRGSSFVPVGRYEGNDWDAYLGFGREAAQDLFIEFGPFYRQNDFQRNEDTAPNYIIPDNYSAYGIRIFLEQNTVQLDRRLGLPRAGFVATALVEREWNDNNEAFGVSPGFLTDLPSSVWRLRGRLEWYLPQSSESAWEIFVTGMLADEKDRVVTYDASHPPGNLWVDGQLRLRLPFSDSIFVTPFVQGQFLRILEEDGNSAGKEFFFGGGVDAWIHFSESVSFNAWYSYLDNESRPSVSITEDVHGESMFFAGFVVRFGGRRN